MGQPGVDRVEPGCELWDLLVSQWIQAGRPMQPHEFDEGDYVALRDNDKLVFIPARVPNPMSQKHYGQSSFRRVNGGG